MNPRGVWPRLNERAILSEMRLVNKISVSDL